MVGMKLQADRFLYCQICPLDVTDIMTIQTAKGEKNLTEGNLIALMNNGMSFSLSIFFMVSSKLIWIISHGQTGAQPECDF